MMTMLDIDRHRLSRLLGMMGSNADGEALNAARAADRLVRQHGLTWPDVIVGCFTSGYAAGFDDGFDDGLAEGKRECIEIAEDDPTHTVKARRCLDDLDDLTAREREFLRDMMQWRRRVSPKQSSWLDAIYARWRSDPSRHYRPDARRARP